MTLVKTGVQRQRQVGVKSTPTNRSNKAVTAKKAKKAYKPSDLQKAVGTANSNWKDNTRSVSALIKYVQGDGKKDFEKLINEQNKAKGVSLSFSQFNSARKVLALWGAIDASRAEKGTETRILTNSKGEKRVLFSWFYLGLAVSYAARTAKAELKAAK